MSQGAQNKVFPTSHTDYTMLNSVLIGLDTFRIGLCCAWLTQSCLTFCDPLDSSSLGSSIHGILWARIWEWIANLFSQRSSLSRDQTCISWLELGSWSNTSNIAEFETTNHISWMYWSHLESSFPCFLSLIHPSFQGIILLLKNICVLVFCSKEKLTYWSLRGKRQKLPKLTDTVCFLLHVLSFSAS